MGCWLRCWQRLGWQRDEALKQWPWINISTLNLWSKWKTWISEAKHKYLNATIAMHCAMQCDAMHYKVNFRHKYLKQNMCIWIPLLWKRLKMWLYKAKYKYHDCETNRKHEYLKENINIKMPPAVTASKVMKVSPASHQYGFPWKQFHQ